MSDGLRAIAAAITVAAAGSLLEMDPSVFIDNERVVFDFVRDHFRQYRVLPAAQTVLEETGVRLPVAHETVEFYYDAVHDRKIYNSIRESYAVMREQLASRDIAAISETIRQMHQSTRGSGRQIHVHSLAEAMALSLRRLETTRGLGGITGVETGWFRFDTITGGYQNADLITWVGRPGTGKTYIALRQAQKAFEAGHNVLFVTTEMGAEQIARRSISLQLGIDPTQMKLNMLSTYTERRIRNLVTSMMTREGFNIFSVGMNSKVAAIEALIQEYSPDIVFIDGVYLLHPSAKGVLKRIERVGEVFDELKGVNIASNIPFVTTTQLNRQAGKDGKDASLETIGFSDAIGTHSSIVVALKHGPSVNPRESRTFEFMKGREGEIGSVSCHFKFAPLNFDEYTLTEEDRNTEEGPNVDWMDTNHAQERRHRRDRRDGEE